MCGAILGDWMIVYGGLDAGVHYLNDVQAFNFKLREWKPL
jgi:hypothetical protein